MCVIIAKHFPKQGWVGVKNRDRNYTPKIGFAISEQNDIERLLFEDKITGYKEGFNGNGVAILSASLMVQDDEKEVTKSSNKHSPDGRRIANALLEDTAVLAARKAIKNKLTGNTIIYDKDTLFLLEACKKDDEYHYVCRKIPTDQVVARTNHGIWLEWAGYQRKEDNESETLSRISSEARRLQAQNVVENAKDPMDMVNGLCQIHVDNPQLNVMRTSTERKKMRTTAQEMIIPSEQTLYCRPISSHIEFDFWDFNKPERKCWVEILSNRALWEKFDKENHPFTASGMHHST
jgi:hypothetical protein